MNNTQKKQRQARTVGKKWGKKQSAEIEGEESRSQANVTQLINVTTFNTDFKFCSRRNHSQQQHEKKEIYNRETLFRLLGRQ